MGFFSRKRPELPSQTPLERRGRVSLRTLASRRTTSADRPRKTLGRVETAVRAEKTLPQRQPLNSLPPDSCRFVISSRALGKGSYGSVFSGADHLTREPVAVKLIADGRMKPGSLQKEVAILQRLSKTNHPSFLRFHAYIRPHQVRAGELKQEGSDTLPHSKPLGQCHALVMEAAQGGELFEYVVKADGLQEYESAPIFADLVDAVHTAHRLGIAHRDLKLENVLLVGRRGEPNANDIKLIDWGLAHQHDMAADGTAVREKLYSRCGSRSYMAPEVANRHTCSVVGYDGFCADVWSLGVCLFAIHMGFFPFEQVCT